MNQNILEKSCKKIKNHIKLIKRSKHNENYNNVDDFKSLKSIDLEDIKTTKINDLKIKDEAKTRIMKYIKYKKWTEKELRKKFKNEIDEQLLDEIIEYLKEANYLDDYQFIQKQVNEYMMLKTLSIRELKYKLLEKGLDKKLVEKYIEDNREELEEYEKKCIEKIRRKKAGNIEEEKINQYLFRKGYPISKYE